MDRRELLGLTIDGKENAVIATEGVGVHQQVTAGTQLTVPARDERLQQRRLDVGAICGVIERLTKLFIASVSISISISIPRIRVFIPGIAVSIPIAFGRFIQMAAIVVDAAKPEARPGGACESGNRRPHFLEHHRYVPRCTANAMQNTAAARA